jgi:hypothetical protein
LGLYCPAAGTVREGGDQGPFGVIYGGKRNGRSDQGWERRLTRRGGEPLLDLPLFGDRAFAAGAALNFALVFFFGSFMFVLTLLLQHGLGHPPLHAGLQAGPLALAFTTMSVLGPRLAARLGPRSITLGAGLDVLGTTALVLTGARYGAHLTGRELAPPPRSSAWARAWRCRR